MRKAFFTIFVLSLASHFLNAEVVERTEVFDSFTDIELNDDFDVTVEKGPKYSIKFATDARLIDYCRLNKLGATVKVDMDSGNFPKELKSQLNKKGSAIEKSSITITVPDLSEMESITINDKVCLNMFDELNVSHNFTIRATDNAIVSNMPINANEILLEINKKACVKASLRASTVKISSENNAIANIVLRATNAEIETAGSSQLNLSGNCTTMKLEMGGSSKMQLCGCVTTLDALSKGGVNINTEASTMENAIINMTGGVCSVNASEKLQITLAGGAKLTYDNTPEIIIWNIANSSVYKKVKEEKN